VLAAVGAEPPIEFGAQPPANDVRGHEEPPVLIDTDEAARLLGISKAALYQRVSRHQVPGVVRSGRSGRRVQFHRGRLLEGIERKASRR
jgi:hypothetical protein